MLSSGASSYQLQPGTLSPHTPHTIPDTHTHCATQWGDLGDKTLLVKGMDGIIEDCDWLDEQNDKKQMFDILTTLFDEENKILEHPTSVNKATDKQQDVIIDTIKTEEITCNDKIIADLCTVDNDFVEIIGDEYFAREDDCTPPQEVTTTLHCQDTSTTRCVDRSPVGDTSNPATYQTFSSLSSIIPLTSHESCLHSTSYTDPTCCNQEKFDMPKLQKPENAPEIGDLECDDYTKDIKYAEDTKGTEDMGDAKNAEDAEESNDVDNYEDYEDTEDDGVIWLEVGESGQSSIVTMYERPNFVASDGDDDLGEKQDIIASICDTGETLTNSSDTEEILSNKLVIDLDNSTSLRSVNNKNTTTISVNNSHNEIIQDKCTDHSEVAVRFVSFMDILGDNDREDVFEDKTVIKVEAKILDLDLEIQHGESHVVEPHILTEHKMHQGPSLEKDKEGPTDNRIIDANNNENIELLKVNQNNNTFLTLFSRCFGCILRKK